MTSKIVGKAVWNYAIIAALLLNLVFVAGLIRHMTQGPYDPFGEFPIQAAPPQVVIGEPITVSSVKCYEEDVEVVGGWGFRAISPVDAIFPVSNGVNTVAAGCFSFTYENEWSEAAIEFAQRHLDLGETVTLRLEGRETPAQGGVTQFWRTTDFEVVQTEADLDPLLNRDPEPILSP